MRDICLYTYSAQRDAPLQAAEFWFAMHPNDMVENCYRELLPSTFCKTIPVDTDNRVVGDRNIPDDDSLFTNTRKMDMEDVQRILNLMPNRRYSKLIEYR